MPEEGLMPSVNAVAGDPPADGVSLNDAPDHTADETAVPDGQPVTEDGSFDPQKFSELVAEREQKVALSKEVEFLNRKLEALESQLSQSQQQRGEEDYEDTFVSSRELEDFVERKLQEKESIKRKQEVEGAIKEARGKYKDFDAVMNLVRDIADPELIAVLEKTPNPAEYAYRLGQLHPEYQNLKQQASSPSKVKPPANLSQVPGATPSSDGRSWSSASSEEVERKFNSLVFGR